MFLSVQVVCINDPFMDVKYAVYQLTYDSVHGRFPGTVAAGEGESAIGQGKSACHAAPPQRLPPAPSPHNGIVF